MTEETKDTQPLFIGSKHVDHGKLRSKKQLKEEMNKWKSFQYVVTRMVQDVMMGL